jgi:hypothetical protein
MRLTIVQEPGIGNAKFCRKLIKPPFFIRLVHSLESLFGFFFHRAHSLEESHRDPINLRSL